MRHWQYKSAVTLLLIVILPILLVALATLQYSWLTEISRAERERLQARLQADARRYAQDFNAEISKAYFIFQLDAQVWEERDFEPFNSRFDLWRSNAAFSNILGEIYFISEQASRRFNSTNKDFEIVELPDEIASLRNRLLAQRDNDAPHFTFDKEAIDENIPALIIPIYERVAEVSNEKGAVSRKTMITSLSSPKGFVILKLNPEAIINEMLPELIRKHFATDNQNYNYSITSGDKIVFQSTPPFDNLIQSDATTRLFDLSAEATNILVLSGSNLRPGIGESQTKLVRERIYRKELPENSTSGENIPQKDLAESPNVRIVRKDGDDEPVTDTDVKSGLWLLSVQHRDGSLEDFVGRAKWRNLGLSFGVLALLGASVVLLVLSAQRARRAAQRQFDFVSSVSHEFRTPVSVICSAGANLALGIVRSPAQVENYGSLINREGNRIAEMVEQILVFAGARSNRKKYTFQPTDVKPLIEQVLLDSRPLLEGNGFAVEKQIAADLPLIEADAKALRLALENLVGNAVKYSGDNRWIKISVVAKSKIVAISIEDKGIGIDALELKDIFEPFYRGREAVFEQIRGNGLGLSLVKEIVTAHNGKIEVKSERGKGSKFTIQILSKPENENMADTNKQMLLLNL